MAVRLAALFCAVITMLTVSFIAKAASFTPPPIGTIQTGVIDVGNHVQTVLPEGQWVLIAHGLRLTNTGAHEYNPVYLEVRDGVIVRIITISSVTEPPQFPGFNSGYVFNKTCGRVDMHYVKVFANYEGYDQDCWFVNHFEMTAGASPSTAIREATAYIQGHGLVMPINMLDVGFHFANNKTQYLDANYFYNPEAEGFAPPLHADWRTSDWHRDRVYLDPKKVDYIKRLTDWGTGWHDRVKDGFQGKLPPAAKS